jgi:hypothetical protein
MSAMPWSIFSQMNSLLFYSSKSLGIRINECMPSCALPPRDWQGAVRLVERGVLPQGASASTPPLPVVILVTGLEVFGQGGKGKGASPRMLRLRSNIGTVESPATLPDNSVRAVAAGMRQLGSILWVWIDWIWDWMWLCGVLGIFISKADAYVIGTKA